MTFFMITSFLGAIVVALIGLWIARKMDLLDKPGKDVPKRKRVPTLQWVTMLLSFTLLWLVLLPVHFEMTVANPFRGLLIWWWIVALLSFVDELGHIRHKKFHLTPMVRLIGQIIAIVIAYVVSGVGITEFQLPGGLLLEFNLFSSIVLTIAWYLLFINAINRFDGIYGLASGMSSIGFLTIFLLLGVVVFDYYSGMSRERTVLLESVQLQSWLLFCVAFVAFMIEWKPWWLLRDVGTMFLWFSLAYLWLLGWAKIGMMIVVLALPLFDAIWVIIDRLHRRKKHPFKWDYSHLHYRLLALGRTRNEVRVFILGRSVFMLVLMLLLGADRMGKVVIFVLMALMFFGINGYLYRVKWLPVEYKPGEKEKKEEKEKKKKKKKQKQKKVDWKEIWGLEGD